MCSYIHFLSNFISFYIKSLSRIQNTQSQQERKFTYNAIFSRVPANIVSIHSDECYRACVCLCVCVCVFVTLLIEHAMRMRHTVICDQSPSTIFFPLSLIKQLRRKVYRTQNAYFFFCSTLYETFLILRKNELNLTKMSYFPSCTGSLFLSKFNQTLIFTTDFRKIILYQIWWTSIQLEPSDSVGTDGRTALLVEANSPLYTLLRTSLKHVSSICFLRSSLLDKFVNSCFTGVPANVEIHCLNWLGRRYINIKMDF
jgi:hypothetical protein